MNKAITSQNNLELIKERNDIVKKEGFTFHEDKGKGYAESLEIKNKEGKTLGVCEYELLSDGVYIDITAEGKGNGLAEKSIDYLINKYPDKPIIWDAINKESEEIRHYLLRKHPEYKEGDNKNYHPLYGVVRGT